MVHVFENSSLLPAEWRDGARAIRAFNPGLLRDGDGWLLAFRVVAEPGMERRIGLCRLDPLFRVIAGSPVPLSDWIRFQQPNTYAPQAAIWFADPRLYRLAGRLFVYWNSGWHEPQNHQFLQELDPATLRPIGTPRELVLRGERQKLEKNWALFECGDVFAVYSVNPHRVLSVSLDGSGPIKCVDLAPAVSNSGGYAQVHGGLRGGSPPIRVGQHFYSFCHSIENGPDGYCYVVGVYRFSAAAPFPPTDMPREPLRIDLPSQARRTFPKLNPAVADVLYPAGAACENGRWIVSLGIDDERCAIVEIGHDTVLNTLVPVIEPQRR